MFVWCSLVFVCICGFLEWLFGFVKTFSGKQQQQKQKQTNPYPRVSLKPLNTLFCWFSECVVVFFGVRWCSLVFLVFSNLCVGFVKKAFGKTSKTNKTNPYPRVGLKPFKNCVFLVVPNVLLVFFGCLLYLWFSRRMFWFCTNLRENNKTNKPISKGGSETFKNCVVFVFRNVFWVFFGFLLYVWFSRMFCWVFSPLQQCLASLCGFLHGFM